MKQIVEEEINGFDPNRIAGTRVISQSGRTGTITGMHVAYKDFGYPTCWVKWDHIKGVVQTDSLRYLKKL